MSPPASAVDVRCPACGAKAGDPCRTGRDRVTEPHAPRSELYQQTVTEIQKLNAWNQSCQPRR